MLSNISVPILLVIHGIFLARATYKIHGSRKYPVQQQSLVSSRV